MLDGGDPLVVIYLDFEKAFDTVPHQQTCRKLASHGINGNILKWIRELPSDQRVVINCSEPE